VSALVEEELVSDVATEHFDVIIVGAGISGIGSAYHLKTQNPERSYVLLEAMESFGGTWHTHRYPGIRSDSDLYTFGYRFKPWTSAPIATAAEIQKYLSDVIAENEFAPHIRYGHHIDAASWSTSDQRWTVTAMVKDTGESVSFTANFLWMCQGYYRHAEGYTPEWPGMDTFEGRIVHPQTWPEDLDYKDKEVIVIGSGATSATLVPAIAHDVSHVTVLQRSPTYYFTGENRNLLADHLRELEVPEEWVHDIVRRENLFNLRALTQLSMEEPQFTKDALIDLVRVALPEGFDVETHFTPSYMPWRQRIAFLPDGDLFKVISSGQASIVTDEIETFTPSGVTLKSGDELPADIIVTATGFHLSVLGDIAFSIDNEPLDFANTVTYRGMMFTGVPNLVWVFGYFRASWTLRVDIVSDFVCRLLRHMDELGVSSVTPRLRDDEHDEVMLDWIDTEYFNPNYLLRSMHLMPKRLDHPEWRHTQDYWAEREELPLVDLDDGCLVYV
jgi:cation diffusion facilitator CzcD-associated flavoprotein CzcO